MEARKKSTWSTWEELLLAFAVKRHGLKDWESVAMELQNRCSIPAVITAQICKDKYHDLHRRFMNVDAGEGGGDGGGGGGGGEIAIPWLEELRQLRVAELKREVQRYDLSIQSLEMKVKRLEEIEQSRDEESEKADLKEEQKNRSDRSFNESNSTDRPVEPCPVKPDPDSCNDSSDRQKRRRKVKKIEPELSESKEGTKESSDVQSSASLTERRRKKLVNGGGDGEKVAVTEIVTAKRDGDGFVGVFDVIRSHELGPVFERRLDSQKTDDYKKTIRRHIDLETVQARIDDGSYSSNSTRFYLDLLLLFSNAIVFFPKSSLESMAAHQLRGIVMTELKKNTTPSPEPSSTKVLERSDSLLAKHKSAAPIVVCRKRSSISAKQTKLSDDKTPLKLVVKASSSIPDEDYSSTKLKINEKPVTGVRSTRRSSKVNTNPNPSQNQNRNAKQTAKTDKEDATTTTTTDKKRGAADFLKRMKKDSQVASEEGKASIRKEQQKKKPPLPVADERKDGPVRRSSSGSKEVKEESSSLSKKNVGRPPKRGREAAAAATPEKRGSGKDNTNTDKEDSSKRPKKRTRR